MQDETLREALVKRRAHLAGKIDTLTEELCHVDGMLKALGVGQPHKIRTRRLHRGPPLFARGELIALVGAAERAGHKSPSSIALYIMVRQHFNVEDDRLYQRVRESVRACRKKHNAKRRAAHAQLSKD